MGSEPRSAIRPTSTAAATPITRSGRERGGWGKGALTNSALSGSSVLPLELALVGLGLGLGLVMPNLTTAIQNAVAPQDLGVATSAASFFRSLGGALGVALSGAWMTFRLHRLLPVEDASSLGGNAVDHSIAAISALPAAQRALVVNAYRHAIGSTFLLGAIVAALGLLIVLALPERPLRSGVQRHAEKAVEAEPV